MNQCSYTVVAAFQYCDRPAVSNRMTSSFYPQIPAVIRPLPTLSPHNFPISPGVFPRASDRSSATALQATGAVEAAALGFFSSIRIPAALIAGSSLSAFFSKIDKNKYGGTDGWENRWQDRLVFLYHVLSFGSLLLSLNVVITATAAGTTLLLDKYDSVAISAFEFLKGKMYYEMLTTRWSFFISLLSFIGAITARAFVEFDLLQPNRRKLGTVLLLTVGALWTHLISFINGSLFTSPNLGLMTLEMIKVGMPCLFS